MLGMALLFMGPWLVRPSGDAVPFSVGDREVRVTPGMADALNVLRREALGRHAPALGCSSVITDMSRPAVSAIQLYFLCRSSALRATTWSSS